MRSLCHGTSGDVIVCFNVLYSEVKILQSVQAMQTFAALFGLLFGCLLPKWQDFAIPHSSTSSLQSFALCCSLRYLCLVLR